MYIYMYYVCAFLKNKQTEYYSFIEAYIITLCFPIQQSSNLQQSRRSTYFNYKQLPVK